MADQLMKGQIVNWEGIDYRFEGGDRRSKENWTPLPPVVKQTIETPQQSMQAVLANADPAERLKAGIMGGFDQAAYGLKGLFGNQLTPEEQNRLSMSGPMLSTTAGKVGGGLARMAMTAPAFGAAATLPALAGAPTAGLAGALTQAGVQGATGAGLGYGLNTENRGKHALWEGGGAALGSLAASALGGIFSPKPGSYAETLQKAGVPITPGQARGPGVVKTMEEGATTVGIPTGQAQRRAVEGWNEALLKDIVKPTGQTIDAAGYKGITQAREAFSKAFEATDKVAMTASPQAATSAINQIAVQAKGSVGINDAALDSASSKLAKMLRGQNVTLGSLRSAADDLNALASKEATDPALGRAYIAMADVLDGMRAQSGAISPALDRAYAMFRTVTRAAGARGSQGGIFSPEGLASANFARSVEMQRATGSGLLSNEAEAARNVLGSSIPQVGPGTAERLLTTAALGGAVPYALGHPAAAGGALATLAALRAAYTKPGISFLTGAYPWQQLAPTGTLPALSASAVNQLQQAGGQR